MKLHLGVALVVSMLFLISLLSPYLAQSNASANNEVLQNSYGGVIFNIPTIDGPMYLAMDPSNHMLYVASYGGLFELYPSTFSVKAYASSSYSTAKLIYDQKYQKLLLVSKYGGFSAYPGVAIINTTSFLQSSFFSLPGCPFSAVVDPQNGFLYVTGKEISSSSLDYVAAYNPSNESMLWSIKLVSSVLYVSYDPVSNLMVVTGVGLGKIIFLNPLTGDNEGGSHESEPLPGCSGSQHRGDLRREFGGQPSSGPQLCW
ncbi:hypothetical protein [Metallosphaera hakonensis]|uniref:hypothetical protein n=1 Tax=Metallosphaera hakonensis TaxID=79601 RepID=UPI0006CF6E2B|nr:hypothetical protein [Metallosphaera hakonensis]